MTTNQQAFLNEHRVMPGEKCPCCGLPVPDGVRCRDTGELRYILKPPLIVADEVWNADRSKMVLWLDTGDRIE